MLAYGGGGGGGALGILAEGTLTLGASAALRADGGTQTNSLPAYSHRAQTAGGGGSGGAILLGAASIVTNAGFSVSANGGASQVFVTTGTPIPGGRGSGGRIAFYSPEDFSEAGQGQSESAPAGVSIAPGAAGHGNYDAGDGSGTFYDGPALRFLRVPRGTVILIH
jgi:hypothetical protein